MFCVQRHGVVSADGPGLRQHTDHRPPRREGDRDMDPPAAVCAGARAGKDPCGARSAFSHRAFSAAVRVTGPHAFLARRFPSTPSAGTAW